MQKVHKIGLKHNKPLTHVTVSFFSRVCSCLNSKLTKVVMLPGGELSHKSDGDACPKIKITMQLL